MKLSWVVSYQRNARLHTHASRLVKAPRQLTRQAGLSRGRGRGSAVGRPSDPHDAGRFGTDNGSVHRS